MSRCTTNFNPKSDKMMLCPCCGKGNPSVALLILLEVIRAHFGKPVKISSMCRCTKYNREVGSKTDRSRHVCDNNDWEPDAADIVVKGIDPSVVYDFVVQLPYANLLGVGKYNTFTHIDTRGVYARW
jgi:uncharacterized protein YcbK (DUF882 family)